MTTTIIVGTQWGDEGKGKIVDLLTPDADAVVRYQGGNNAGHTVMYEDKKVVLHLIPSGILHGKECILGNGTVIHLPSLISEITELESKGYDVKSHLKISSQAHVICDFHITLDKSKEKAIDAKIGTTGKGIGPAYESKVARLGLRICDISSKAILMRKLRHILKKYKNDISLYVEESLDVTIVDRYELASELTGLYNQIKKYVIDSPARVNALINDKKDVLLEGAQGTYLDLDHGTYPYVTSSNTVAGAACAGAGIGPTKIDRVIGITKAYTTRVGKGPFPTELTDTVGNYLRTTGKEYGATTGRDRRCGWFDALLVRRAVQLNGVTDIALTKLDVLDTLEWVKICFGYVGEDKTALDEFPVTNMESVTPYYHVMPGWQTSTQGITDYNKLPKELLSYIEQIEFYTQARVSIISTGPRREETIFV
jgi:adenylosuccinate synthase